MIFISKFSIMQKRCYMMDTQPKLNVHNTFTCQKRYMNVLYKFRLGHVATRCHYGLFFAHFE